MIKLRGICITNELNRYNHKFTESSLVENYDQQWGQPLPSFANHNHTKAIGYTTLSGIFIEPHFMCLQNSLFVPETEKDEEEVKSFCYDFLYNDRVLKNKNDYDYLKEKLKQYIKGDVKYYYTNGAFIYNEGIVKRAFPDLYAKINEGLIDINFLKPILPGIYQIGEFIVYAHKYFRRGYSYLNTLNTPFLERIEKLKGGTNKVQVAIDLDCIGLASVQRKEYEYSYWGGPVFEDKIENISLGVSVFNNDNYNELMSEVRRTEMGWYLQDDIKTFECEELIDLPNILKGNQQYYGCRYVHSMVDKETYVPIHLDGAVRVYDDEKMINRLDIRMDSAKRNTLYTKIWRLDGSIAISLWKELISHYYRDNTLIGEYFGGKDEVLLQEKKHLAQEEKVISLKDYVPDNITVDSGIKCFIAYSPARSFKKNYDIYIIPTTSIINKTTECATVESISITFNKLLKTKRLKIRLPSAKTVAYCDLVDNLPTYYCKDAKTANIVFGSVKEFCEIWDKRGDDRLVTFSLKIPYATRTATISFAGHVNSFCKYFSSPLFSEIPNNETDLNDWILKFYEADKALFRLLKDVNPLSFVKKNDIIVIDRKSLESEDVYSIKKNDKAIYVELKLPNEDIELLNNEGVGVACIITDEKLQCSKCGKDYRKCNCILFIDRNIFLNVQHFTPIGVFWTNRKD